MGERDTDRLLSEAFKRNAPYVNDLALQECINEKLPLGRKRSRGMRSVRFLAVASACVLLLVGVVFGAYRLVDYLHGPVLVIGDSLPADGSGKATVLAGLAPFVGTAVLERAESEGITSSHTGSYYPTEVTGQVLVYSLDTSQAGISGALAMTSDLNVRADGSADIKGSWTLNNDNGHDAWVCNSWVGYRNADGTEEFGFGNAAGRGGYEGLTLYLQWRSARGPGPVSGAAESVFVTGWIQSAD